MSNVRENAGSYKKADFCMMYYTLLLFSCFAGWTGGSESLSMLRRFAVRQSRNRHRMRRFAKQTDEAQLRFSFSTKEKDREPKGSLSFSFCIPLTTTPRFIIRENVNMHGINPGKRYFLVKKDNNQAFSSACGFLNR